MKNTKHLLKNYIAILLCMTLVVSFVNSWNIAFAANIIISDTLQTITDKENGIDHTASLSNATSSNTAKNINKNNNPNDFLKSVSSTAKSTNIHSNNNSGAVHYLEDSFNTPGKIKLFYGSQLNKPEAAIYYMIGNYLSDAEKNYLTESFTPTWREYVSVNFSNLDSEEYSDFAIDVEHELEIYEYIAREAYSMDHPEYDLTCLQIYNEPNYSDTAVETPEGKTLYSGTITLEITFRFRTPAYLSTVISNYNELSNALNDISLNGDSRFEQVKMIHDYLCNNVTYSTDKEDWSINSSHGAIVEKKANCNGYARAFKVICDHFNIPAIIIAGVDIGECIGNTVEYYDEYYQQHLWNYVQMEDGQWYAAAIDADAMNLSDNYFLIGSKTIPSEEDTSFDNSHQPYSPGGYHRNSFENSGMTYHSLSYPELSEYKYGAYSNEITIENVALYPKEKELSAKIGTLDYAMGNFYYNYSNAMNIEEPTITADHEQCYLYFTVEADKKARLPERMYITVILPDGISFSQDKIESERIYDFYSNSENNEIWDEIFLLYTETAPSSNKINIQYKITDGQEILNQGYKTLVTLNTLSKTNSAELSLNEGTINYTQWNQEMFFNDSSQYSKQLALFSAYMSDMIEGSDKKQLKQRITKDLTALGFSKIYYSGKSENEHIEEFVCATKKVIHDGKVMTILLYAIQGSDTALSEQTGYDWKGNFSYSEENYHGNIMSCKENNLQKLEQYCSIYGLELDDPNIRKLITGHSRGGGIANVVSAQINTDYGQGRLDSLYCYTFAALNVINNKNNNYPTKHTNIINIVNHLDIVPFVPGFNLGKYGLSYIFNGNDNSAVEVIGAARKLSLNNVKNNAAYLAYAAVTAVAKKLLDNHSMSKYEEAIISDSLMPLTEYKNDFYDFCDELDKKFQTSGKEILIRLISVPLTFLESSIYMASNLLTVNLVRHIILCPVDIDIIDSTGKIVCSIKNNEITAREVDDITIIIEGDKKEILFAADADYQIQIKGYDEGTMDYRVIVPDENGLDKTLYSFSELPVHKDSIAITATNNNSNPVFNNEYGIMTPDKIVDSSEFNYVTINLDSDTEGVVTSGSNEYIKGDFVWAYALNDDKNRKFVGWFDENGSLISKNVFYSFIANEDAHYTAKFCLNGQSYCDINGHTEYIIKGKPSTCTSKGTSDMTCCSICNKTLIDKKELPLAEHTLVVSKAIEATTTATGLTEGIKCSVCGLVIKEQQIIPKLNNSDNTHKDPKPDSSGGNSPSGGNNSSSGGGSSSSNGSGSSSGGSSGNSAKGSTRKISGSTTDTAALPDYVVQGTWKQLSDTNWKFTDSKGILYANRWAAIENPYANVTLGQAPFDWFYFDTNGNMVTGWYQDGENLFYLNPNSDGTKGRMITGWFWISDQNNVWKCYYFNPISDGTCGKLIRNSVINGDTVNENGEWTVNGVVQTK